MMTSATFIDAVTAMKGLVPGMVEHLSAMAPNLTDEEREQTLATLQPLSGQIETLEEEQVKIFDDAQKAAAALKRTEVPKIKQTYEANEKQSAESSFDTQFRNI